MRRRQYFETVQVNLGIYSKYILNALAEVYRENGKENSRIINRYKLANIFENFQLYRLIRMINDFPNFYIKTQKYSLIYLVNVN